MATKKKVVKKEELTKEDKIIMKLSNKWEFLGYVFKYKLGKFFMVAVIAILTIIILKMVGFNYASFQSFLKGMGL